MFKQICITSGLVLALAFAGCASSGQDRSKASVASLKQTHAQLDTASRHVDGALAAMNSLQYGPDLQKKFNTFTKEVKGLESEANAVRKSAAAMRSRSADYIKKWQSEMSKTGNAELQQAAETRRAAIQSRFGEITNAHDAVRDAYTTFHSDLVNLRTYLSNDLTEAGIKASAPAMKKANDDATILRQKTADYRTILRDVAGDMTGAQM